MKIEDKLISVIVTSYNNFNYLYECLDSIVKQTYKNIELIVTDDGSYDFNQKELEDWLRIHSDENIKNITINQNTTNWGTVKNVNAGLKIAKGDVITMIAADDKYENDNAFTWAMRKIETLPEDALVLTTQVAMCDQQLSSQYYPFMNERTLNTLQYGSVKDLLKLELIGSLLPSCGTFYKKEVFERYGLCDEKYDLIEDHVLHLKLLKAGVRFYYLDEITVLHRSGGVSHGTEGASKSIRFWTDCMHVYDYEVLPLIDEYLNETEKKEVLATYKSTKSHYQAAIGEPVPIAQVINTKSSVALDMLAKVVEFLFPRIRTISKYALVFGFALCLLPKLVDGLTIPFSNYTIGTEGAPMYGGILIVLAVAIVILNEIPRIITRFYSIKRRFTVTPIARFLEAIWVEEKDE